MRGTSLSWFILLYLTLVDETAALFPLAAGLFDWGAPDETAHHDFPTGHGHYEQGHPSAYDVLHTQDHRTHHGPDGERIKTGSKRILGRELKYRPNENYGGKKGRTQWKMFGRELQYGEKEHLKTYPISDRRIEMNGKPFEYPHAYSVDSSRKPKWTWTERADDGNDDDDRGYGHYNGGYDDFDRFLRNKRYIDNDQPPWNNRYNPHGSRPFLVKYGRNDIPSRSPTIGNPGMYKARHESYIVHPPRKSVYHKPRESIAYFPTDDLYVDEYYNTDWEDLDNDYRFAPVRPRNKFSRTLNPSYSYYLSDVNHQPAGVYHYHINDPNTLEYILLDDGWVEVENLEPYKDRYKWIDYGNGFTNF